MKAKKCIVSCVLLVCLVGGICFIVQAGAGTNDAVQKKKPEGIRLSGIPDVNISKWPFIFEPPERFILEDDTVTKKRINFTPDDPNLAELFDVYRRVTGFEPKLTTINEQRDTLRGLEYVIVSINCTVNPEIERSGLTKELLQTDTELTFRRYGVKVLSKEYIDATIARRGEFSAYFGSFDVTVVIDIRKTIPWLAVYASTAELRQCSLLNLPGKGIPAIFAPTWRMGPSVGSAGMEYVKDGVRDNVRDAVERFVNDYLTANPKVEDKLKNTEKKGERE